MTCFVDEIPSAPVCVDELSAAGLLGEVSQALRVRRAAEVAELELGAQWAVLHGEPRDVRDPMVSPGGEGTPALREYAVPELAMARETHPATTRALVADVLDLVHRLPLTWARVRSLECEPWVARKVAVVSRALAVDAVGVVDRAVAAAIAGHAPSTVLEIARAKVVEADPETHAMERERSRHERYVTLSRADEFGFRHVIARVNAGDAAWIDALVDRVADILALEHGHDHNRDELRADALGWLARPADLLRLLLEHTRDADGPAGRPAWATGHLADTVERLAALTPRQLASLHGRGTVFVHLTDRALTRHAGIARVEGVGPLLVQSLAELLGHADVTLQPVLDLAERRRVDAYEHPDRVKDHVWTQTGGDVFPFSPRTATRDRVDFDHPTPYVPPDRDGPPGQTGAHNSGPLRRRHHRWEDPRWLPLPTGRTRTAPVADPARTLLPGRPHRHPPAHPRAGRGHPQHTPRRRDLLRRPQLTPTTGNLRAPGAASGTTGFFGATGWIRVYADPRAGRTSASPLLGQKAIARSA